MCGIGIEFLIKERTANICPSVRPTCVVLLLPITHIWTRVAIWMGISRNGDDAMQPQNAHGQRGGREADLLKDHKSKINGGMIYSDN